MVIDTIWMAGYSFLSTMLAQSVATVPELEPPPFFFSMRLSDLAGLALGWALARGGFG